MGDKNSNRPYTLGDYFQPSHEGYRNSIKLPKEAKVSPLRFGTIQLVQNECVFHEIRSEDPIQQLKMAIDYAAGERLRKLRPEEASETIEDLA
nr:MAK10-like protein [Tanacetum cinerariifolium]